MAFTVSSIAKPVFGNQRLHVMRVTTDGAEDLVSSGFNYIDFMTVTPIKCTDGAFAAYPNSGTTGTAIAGSIGFSGCATGDIFQVVVYGH